MKRFLFTLFLPAFMLTAQAQITTEDEPPIDSAYLDFYDAVLEQLSDSDQGREVVFLMQFEAGECFEYLLEKTERNEEAPADSSAARFRLEVLSADSVSALIRYELLEQFTPKMESLPNIGELINNAIEKGIHKAQVIIRVSESGAVRHIENMPEIRACIRDALSEVVNEVYMLYSAQIEAANAEADEDDVEEETSHHEFKQMLKELADEQDETKVLDMLDGISEVFELAGSTFNTGDTHQSDGNADSHIDISFNLSEQPLPDYHENGYKVEVNMMRLDLIDSDIENDNEETKNGNTDDEERLQGESETKKERTLLVTMAEAINVLDDRFRPISSFTKSNIAMDGTPYYEGCTRLTLLKREPTR